MDGYVVPVKYNRFEAKPRGIQCNDASFRSNSQLGLLTPCGICIQRSLSISPTHQYFACCSRNDDGNGDSEDDGDGLVLRVLGYL